MSNKNQLSKKRKFIIARLKELSILPDDLSTMNENESKIYNEIWNYNFTLWEEIKENNGWGTKPKTTFEIQLADKRRKARAYLRTYGFLPPYGEPLTNQQQNLLDLIEKNDYSEFENIKKTKQEDALKKRLSKTPPEPVGTLPKHISDHRQLPGYTASSEPKHVHFRLRLTQILPPIGIDLNDEQKEIVKDIEDNWFGKSKSHFVIKYLHLSSPEGRILYRAYKRHKDEGYNFNLTIEDIIIPEYCPFLNIKLSTDPKDFNEPFYYSIDRIDNSKGYVKGNVQIISKKANTMKHKSTELELLQFATNAHKLFEYQEV